MEEKDYSHLEGKKIDVLFTDGECEALVVNVEKDIGITIVRENDHESELVCLDGPSSKIWKDDMEKGHHSLYHERYDEIFDAVINMIEEGVFDSAKVILMYKSHSFSCGSLQQCSFL